MIEKQKNSDNSSKATPERNSSSVAALSSGPTSLPDDVLEKLFRSYSLKQKRSGLTSFIVASVVFDLWAILVPQGQSAESLGKENHLLRQSLLYEFIINLSPKTERASYTCFRDLKMKCSMVLSETPKVH
jgi:hypothetical protein